MAIKRAQITLFLILGLILVFVIGTGYYFISNIQKEKIKEIPEKVQQVNLEAYPVRNYIEECIKKLTIN